MVNCIKEMYLSKTVDNKVEMILVCNLTDFKLNNHVCIFPGIVKTS